MYVLVDVCAIFVSAIIKKEEHKSPGESSSIPAGEHQDLTRAAAAQQCRWEKQELDGNIHEH